MPVQTMPAGIGQRTMSRSLSLLSAKRFMVILPKAIGKAVVDQLKRSFRLPSVCSHRKNNVHGQPWTILQKWSREANQMLDLPTVLQNAVIHGVRRSQDRATTNNPQPTYKTKVQVKT